MIKHLSQYGFRVTFGTQNVRMDSRWSLSALLIAASLLTGCRTLPTESGPQLVTALSGPEMVAMGTPQRFLQDREFDPNKAPTLYQAQVNFRRRRPRIGWRIEIAA